MFSKFLTNYFFKICSSFSGNFDKNFFNFYKILLKLAYTNFFLKCFKNNAEVFRNSCKIVIKIKNKSIS